MTQRHPEQPLGWIDTTLVVLFLLGLYLGVSLQITSKIPLTCALSGIAGVILLWRRRNQLDPVHLGGLLAVIALYLASILSAENYNFLSKRFTGLLQLTYSLVISYAFFVTLVHAERRQIARILLTFCVLILIGVLLEQYAGLRVVSDAVRARIHEASQIYVSDLRDQVLYGRIRPKLFTSEPSAVTFVFTHYCFAWLVVCQWRWKLAVYVALMSVGLVLMPGPTLLLMLVLAVPYLVLLGGRQGQQARPGADRIRLVGSVALSGILVAGAVVVGSSVFAERIHHYASGGDASTFYRVFGPMLVAFDVFKKQPWAGAGLTGEEFIADQMLSVYVNSGMFATVWRVSKITDTLTNYFWLHWIYLGLVWGAIMIVALSLWLRSLGVPSVLFCWATWAILGQAAGSYVGPRTWAVLLISAAGSVLAVRPERRSTVASSRAPAPGYTVLAALMAARRPRSAS